MNVTAVTDAQHRPGCLAADVCVYGATPAGVFAAIAAARAGSSVLLIEPSGIVGGLIASGLNATDIGSPEVIRGLGLEFYERCGPEYGEQIELRPEPKVAEKVFRKMLADTGRVQLIEAEVIKASKYDARIDRLHLVDGRAVAARYFIDATYEGDLMPLAGVSFRLGREARDEFGEPHAGRTSLAPLVAYESARRIPATDASGKLLTLVEPNDGEREGSADSRVQAYSFRLTVTNKPEIKREIPEPDYYNPADFELFRRLVSASPEKAHQIREVVVAAHKNSRTYRSGYFNFASISGGKRDVNAGHLVPFNLPGLNRDWITSTWAGRRKIYSNHKKYTLGLLYFMRNDQSVPEAVKNFLADYGFCSDEYSQTEGFPPLLYVREGRRLVGEKVFTELDLLSDDPELDSAIAIGRYHLDCKNVQWTVHPDTGAVVREGMFYVPVGHRYVLPFWIIVPRRVECENLLVPVGASVSHVGFASIRMEPHWMQLGEAAGHAVALAMQTAGAVQDVSVRALQNALGLNPGLIRRLAQRPASLRNQQASPGAALDQR